MSDTPLIIGKTYRICDTSANGFIGVGVLLSIDPPEYPKGSYEFRLIDDPEGIERGVFNREQIKE